jgi:hypothetical protein
MTPSRQTRKKPQKTLKKPLKNLETLRKI